MTRDYAKQDLSTSFSLHYFKQLSPRSMGILAAAVILIIGLLLSLIFKSEKKVDETDPHETTVSTAGSSSTPTSKSSEHTVALNSATTKTKASEVPAKTKVPQKVKPRFDFYTLLPQATTESGEPALEATTAQKNETTVNATRQAVASTSSQTFEKSTAGSNSKAAAQELQKDLNYVLQAGSFKSFEEADHLRARLSLMGFENPFIKEVNLGVQAWYRVYIGPFGSKAEALGEQQRLEHQNLSGGLILKIRT